MTTANGRPMVALLLVALAVPACASSGGGGAADAGDTRAEDTRQGACSGLSQEACEASDECMAIEGWPMPQACLVWQDKPPVVQPAYVGCAPAGVCSQAFTWAHPEDAEAEFWLFPSLCTPGGWVKTDGDPCESKCQPQCGDGAEASECGVDDGCGGTCLCADGYLCVPSDHGPLVCFSYDVTCPGLCGSSAQVPDGGAECGEVWTGLGNDSTCDCGSCPGEQEVCIEYKCACQPNCDELRCDDSGCHANERGDEGCGGSCGECGEGYCHDGLCMHIDPTPCEAICADVQCGIVHYDPDAPDHECDCGSCPDGFDCVGHECICVPSCENIECGDDGCGGSCGECPVECTTHGQCGEGQLCLGEPEGWEPKEVCGFCGDVEDCHCATPDWPDPYHCATDADCEQVFSCGDQCDDCPVTCPKCAHGWCAYGTFETVVCICPVCA